MAGRQTLTLSIKVRILVPQPASKMILIVVCSFMLWGIAGKPPSAYAETFQWTDEHGTAGFTDNVLTVPRQHRKGVVKRQVREPVRSSTSSETAETPPSGAPVEKEIVEGDEPASERERWRERLQTAKAKIVALRAERGELEKKVDESQRGRWFTFGPGASDLEQLKDVPKVEQEIKDLDQQIKQLEEEVSIVIPREARRAGIPPGWIR